jgi:hypothetical protein
LEVVGLERGSLSLVSITEELLEWKSSGFESGRPRLTAMGICCTVHVTLYPQKLAVSSPTSSGRSVGIVRLQTTAMEFSFINIQRVTFRLCTEMQIGFRVTYLLLLSDFNPTWNELANFSEIFQY